VRRLLLVLALLLTGCGPAPAAAAASPLAFTGTTVDGRPFDASTLAGRPALLWFWAPWCATCAAQSGSVVNVQDTYGGKLAVLGIAGMGDNKAMHEFVSDLDVRSVTNLDDSAGVLWRKFGITEQSTYVLIDRAGKVLDTSYLDDIELNTRVKTLVG